MQLQYILALGVMFITGLILIIGAIVNWTVFFENKSWFLTRKFGPAGERVAYAFVGLLIILMACYVIYTGKFENAG